MGVPRVEIEGLEAVGGIHGVWHWFWREKEVCKRTADRAAAMLCVGGL
jgi:hypothetical protein